MEKKNRFNNQISQLSPENHCRTKCSNRIFDFHEKSEDDTNSDLLNDQSMFSNFYFNKSYNGVQNNKTLPHVESSVNDSKNSFERENKKNFSIKFVNNFKPLNSLEKMAGKNNSKIVENEDNEKKSNNSFNSAKGKKNSTNTHQIRYSIDRNIKFDFETLKDNMNSNYHPKFWTNEDIQKLYGCKLKFNSVNSSSNGSLNFLAIKGDDDVRLSNN